MRMVIPLTAALVLSASPALAQPPPASAFGRIPAVVQAAISPNGQHIAVLGSVGDEGVLTLATVDQTSAPSLPFGKVEPVDVRWAGDDYVIASVAVFDRLGVREAYRIERNISVNLQGRAVANLLGGLSASSLLTGHPILGMTAANPLRVMTIGLRSTPLGAFSRLAPTLFSVDPATGKGAPVDTGDYGADSWSVDLTGSARVSIRLDAGDNRLSLMARPKGRARYTALWSAERIESVNDYLGYSDPEDAAYLLDNGHLIRKRLSTGAAEPIESAPALPSDLTWDQNRQVPVGVVADDGETPNVVWLDPEIGAVHNALANIFKDQVVNLSGWSTDRSRFIARVSSRAKPTVWYLFDRSRKELSPLGDEYPELKDAALGKTRWITYAARDGLAIPAYVTLPPGAPETGGKLPLIVLPHGGPAARDEAGFDFLAQFLATRGYVVLQPQFRGSAGFGKDYELAGRGEWGGKMQTDLLDGISTLAGNGTIDPARVCIVGASFGGYAALAGAALHSDTYRCAASFAGVSDLGLLLVETGRLYGRDSLAVKEWRRMLGDAALPKLTATSPAKQVASVKIPVLLVHGDKDTVVAPEQSQLMADALKAAGKPYELLVLKDEDHYLTHSQTRTQLLAALETFLAKNLPTTP